ncbi:MAG: hypothetical protein J0I77_18620 [Rudaea sp.]|uniref:hypothetical protein n=1 Tax=unclassified Rudaea TaxID=2627037 RepID=UPI0010F8BD86|nr:MULTISPECIES: hypothetical protein [unclassified Rudaea]MBN8887747.1 hypothetical protein [Rudaea sp.]MBR0346632.1 hypothetical protein [Rudaea sp.]
MRIDFGSLLARHAAFPMIDGRIAGLVTAGDGLPKAWADLRNPVAFLRARIMRTRRHAGHGEKSQLRTQRFPSSKVFSNPRQKFFFAEFR